MHIAVPRIHEDHRMLEVVEVDPVVHAFSLAHGLIRNTFRDHARRNR
jgi:hypothetical protein